MKGREHYENVVDRVMQSLQQPCADLRGTGFDSLDVTHNTCIPIRVGYILYSMSRGCSFCYHLINSFIISFKQSVLPISFHITFTFIIFSYSHIFSSHHLILSYIILSSFTFSFIIPLIKLSRPGGEVSWIAGSHLRREMQRCGKTTTALLLNPILTFTFKLFYLFDNNN